MARSKQQPCPVCGNNIEPVYGMPIFKCKFCRRPIEQFIEKKKGKTIIRLEEKI